jgi:hypothetical protein
MTNKCICSHMSDKQDKDALCGGDGSFWTRCFVRFLLQYFSSSMRLKHTCKSFKGTAIDKDERVVSAHKYKDGRNKSL